MRGIKRRSASRAIRFPFPTQLSITRRIRPPSSRHWPALFFLFLPFSFSRPLWNDFFPAGSICSPPALAPPLGCAPHRSPHCCVWSPKYGPGPGFQLLRLQNPIQQAAVTNRHSPPPLVKRTARKWRGCFSLFFSLGFFWRFRAASPGGADKAVSVAGSTGPINPCPIRSFRALRILAGRDRTTILAIHRHHIGMAGESQPKPAIAIGAEGCSNRLAFSPFSFFSLPLLFSPPGGRVNSFARQRAALPPPPEPFFPPLSNRLAPNRSAQLESRLVVSKRDPSVPEQDQARLITIYPFFRAMAELLPMMCFSGNSAGGLVGICRVSRPIPWWERHHGDARFLCPAAGGHALDCAAFDPPTPRLWVAAATFLMCWRSGHSVFPALLPQAPA